MKKSAIKAVISERGVLDGLLFLLEKEKKAVCREYRNAAKASGGTLPESAFYTLDWSDLALHNSWKFDVGVYDAADNYDTSDEKSLIVYVGGRYFSKVDLRRISKETAKKVSEIIWKYVSIRLDYFQPAGEKKFVCSDYDLEQKFKAWGFPDCTFRGSGEDLYECLSELWGDM
ncbi:MAG: hypothetical protein LBL08_02120 [Candidatus Nomurabacteria bacterium]|nr:hypothetical protein [Candidatus Nomurabacteria bacterium]